MRPSCEIKAVDPKISVCKRHCGDDSPKKDHQVTAGGGSVHSEERIPTLSERTIALVRGLDLIFEHHEVPVNVRAALDLQVHAYLDSSDSEMVWLQRCKWLLTYPLAKYLRNVLPNAPDDGSLFEPSGVLRAWIRSRTNAFNRKNTHLWYSWFQAKRATLPLSDDLVDKTYQKHFQTLTKSDLGDDATIEAIFADRTFSRLLSKVTEQITTNLSRISPFEELSPSASACFEQTRGSGGQRYELRARLGIDSQQMWGTMLIRMEWRAYVHGRDRESNVTMEVRGHPDVKDQWSRIRDLASAWNTTVPTSCTIQAVLEPNKVRVISKGEAIPYYSMRPLQKAMHSAMREMPCFRLIGRPFSATDVIDLRSKAATSWKWFSIDYSAATDGLSWKYSGAIFRCLISQLPRHQFELAMSVLGPHNLYYPTRDGKKEFRGVQRNGQLMGSVLSFPILCLANLGVYLLATQELQQGWTDDQRLNHVLINGDDMLYAAPKELWEKHVAIGKRVGLEMSIGKAYVHDTYLNINSVSVHCPLKQPQVHPWRIDYLNVGLAFGQHKVQNRPDSAMSLASCDEEKPEGYVCNINTVLEGCLPGKQTLMMKWILEHQRDKIREETCATQQVLVAHTGPRTVSQFVLDGHLNRKPCGAFAARNLFLPVQIGGLGVIPPLGWKFRVTNRDCSRALYYLLSHSAKASLQRPLPGYELNSVDLDVNEPWLKLETEQDSRRDSAKRAYRDMKCLEKASRSSTLQRADRLLVRSIVTLERYDTSATVWQR